VFLLLAVMALAAAGVFVLMPRASTLMVNVADTKGIAVAHAEVVVDGKKRCADPPCLFRDLAPGAHEVRVTSNGFDPPAPRTVTLDGRRDALADFQLVPAKGSGFKVSGAPNVKLAVDGKDVGLLPVEKRDLEPGEHQLHFSGERYLPLDKTVTVTQGEVVDLGAVPLKVAKGRVVLELGTPGARVFLVNSGKARKEVPQLPMAIDFEPTESWELLATKDGFEDFHEAISFADGRADKAITITLSPKAPGAVPSLTVAALPPAVPAPEPAPRPASAPAPAPAPARPKPASAGGGGGGGGGDENGAETVLKINSLPASSIMLDGKAIGSTPQPHVVVTPGSHTVTFVNSELSLKKTITVVVTAGESKAAFARLRD
jgi:serine/threonine-protein kinase